MKAKLIVIVAASCVALASGLILHAAMNRATQNRGKEGGRPGLPAGHPALPVGLIRPGSLPPGPQRDAMQARLDAFVSARREWADSMREARDAAELAADQERQRYLQAVEQARNPDGSVNLHKMPEWARNKLIESAETERRDSERRGPSKLLKEVVGERSGEELFSIYREVYDVGLLHQKGVPSYRDLDRVAGAVVARLAERAIKVSVDQAKALIAVDPIGSLWMRD